MTCFGPRIEPVTFQTPVGWDTLVLHTPLQKPLKEKDIPGGYQNRKAGGKWQHNNKYLNKTLKSCFMILFSTGSKAKKSRNYNKKKFLTTENPLKNEGKGVFSLLLAPAEGVNLA